MQLLSYISSAIWSLVLVLLAWRILVFFQQDEYSRIRFLRWTIKNFMSTNLFILITGTIYIVAMKFWEAQTEIALAIRILYGGVLTYWIYKEIRKPRKIRLAYTARLKRLIICSILILTSTKFVLDLSLFGGHNFLYIAITDIVLG